LGQKKDIGYGKFVNLYDQGKRIVNPVLPVLQIVFSTGYILDDTPDISAG